MTWSSERSVQVAWPYRPDERELNVTGRLKAWQDGDQSALDRLSPYAYEELKRHSRRYLSGESAGHTLQATALVNEAFIRLVDSEIDVHGRKHFYIVAARMMRRILVDHARTISRLSRASSYRSTSLAAILPADFSGIVLMNDRPRSTDSFRTCSWQTTAP